MSEQGKQGNTDHRHPERSLWQNVLLIAVDDAINGPAQLARKENKITAIKEARAYLTQPSADLAEVCSNADMDMHAVIDRMRRLIADAPSPDELASGRKTHRNSLSKRTEQPTTKRTVKRITHNGETLKVSEWAARLGVDAHVVHRRLANGWSVQDAVTLSLDDGKRRSRIKTKGRQSIT